VSLRIYQEHDLLEVREKFRLCRAVLLVQPTGAGKGFLAAHIVRTASGRSFRVMFLVNRRALVNDMSKRVSKLGLEHGVIMGDDPRYNLDHPVQVASIDTIYRRQNLPPADLLIIDEARFAVTPTWMKVVALYPNAKILGLDATPMRTDGMGLGHLFQAMVQGPSVENLIGQGYLVPSVVFRPQGAPSLSGVQKQGGEFNQKQLAEVCDKPKLVGDVVEQWKKRAQDRKTAAFCVNKHHALQVAEKFRCAGFDWAYVDDETSDNERDHIWEDFDNGNLNGVSSVGVISYGWDHSICSCVISAAATESVSRWRQTLGRGGRIHPGKTDFFVLDHFDNSGRLNAFFEDQVEWSLDGKAIRDTGETSGSVSMCRKCFASFRSGPFKCPYCGAEIPKQVRRIQTVKGELEEERRRQQKQEAIAEWQSGVAEDTRRAKYEEFRQIAKMRGYKPTWPNVRFHIIYGHWPPKEWSRGA
jgi:DNA repair protein RadD